MVIGHKRKFVANGFSLKIHIAAGLNGTMLNDRRLLAGFTVSPVIMVTSGCLQHDIPIQVFAQCLHFFIFHVFFLVIAQFHNFFKSTGRL